MVRGIPVNAVIEMYDKYGTRVGVAFVGFYL